MNRFTLALAGAVTLAAPALAQTPEAARTRLPRGAVIEENNTGGVADVVIPRGPTGADTYQSNSAAAGNAGQPERAVPQGSGGAGGNGSAN